MNPGAFAPPSSAGPPYKTPPRLSQASSKTSSGQLLLPSPLAHYQAPRTIKSCLAPFPLASSSPQLCGGFLPANANATGWAGLGGAAMFFLFVPRVPRFEGCPLPPGRVSLRIARVREAKLLLVSPGFFRFTGRTLFLGGCWNGKDRSRVSMLVDIRDKECLQVRPNIHRHRNPSFNFFSLFFSFPPLSPLFPLSYVFFPLISALLASGNCRPRLMILRHQTRHVTHRLTVDEKKSMILSMTLVLGRLDSFLGSSCGCLSVDIQGRVTSKGHKKEYWPNGGGTNSHAQPWPRGKGSPRFPARHATKHREPTASHARET